MSARGTQTFIRAPPPPPPPPYRVPVVVLDRAPEPCPPPPPISSTHAPEAPSGTGSLVRSTFSSVNGVNVGHSLSKLDPFHAYSSGSTNAEPFHTLNADGSTNAEPFQTFTAPPHTTHPQYRYQEGLCPSTYRTRCRISAPTNPLYPVRFAHPKPASFSQSPRRY
ncbi:hypothetical protein Henu3_gp59 [Mycobacterium phage Henu3 PeY-2017]|nr:hypothetical protein Henu3_gp59 [Mycobacterium phage Henu3 PeY-2017]